MHDHGGSVQGSTKVWSTYLTLRSSMPLGKSVRLPRNPFGIHIHGLLSYVGSPSQEGQEDSDTGLTRRSLHRTAFESCCRYSAWRRRHSVAEPAMF